MHCTQCGTIYADGARFCSSCGTSLGVAPRSVDISNFRSGKRTQAAGCAIAIFSAIAWIVAATGNIDPAPSTAMNVWGLIFICGLVTWLSGKVKHWYHAE